MKKKKTNGKKIKEAASVYTGIVLGAGFASGQELFSFFLRFGPVGIIGIIIAGVLLGLSGWAVMDIAVTQKITNFTALLDLILGKKMSRFIHVFIVIISVLLFSTMLAGTGAFYHESGFGPPIIGIVLMALAAFVTFLFDVEGIISASTIIAPILVIGLVFFGIFTYVTDVVPAFALENVVFTLNNNLVFMAILYASFNIITAVTVLSSMPDTVTNQKIAKMSGLLGGGAIILLGTSLSLPLLKHAPFISHLEIPLLGLATNYPHFIKGLFGFMFIGAIYTTAIGNGFAVIQWLESHTKIPSLLIKIGITTLGIFMALFGFSNFVGIVYPLIGLIGLFELLMILIYFIKQPR